MQELINGLKRILFSAELVIDLAQSAIQAMEKVAIEAFDEVFADMLPDPEALEELAEEAQEVALVKESTCYREPVLPHISRAKHLLKCFPVGFQ